MPKNLSNLKPAKGSVKNKTRRGRGKGSGLGGHTAGRGHKGYQSRSGSKSRAWFEGGQMPIQRRLPKRGFTNIFREEFQIFNIIDLERVADVAEITPEVLVQYGIVKYVDRPIKMLGVGDISRAVKVNVSAVSATAKEKIEAAGGSVEVPPPAGRRGKLVKKQARG